MESLIDGQHGVTTLLAGLIIVLSLHLILSLVKFLWSFVSKKNISLEEKIDEMIVSHHEINNRLRRIETDSASLPRLKLGVRRIFNILRYQAGSDWQKYLKIMDDDLES